MDSNWIKGRTLAELEAMEKELSKSISQRTKVRARIQKILDDAGMSADEVFGDAGTAEAATSPAQSTAAAPQKSKAKKVRRKKASKKSKSKVAAKYRNPADPTQTWAGRGRKPQWLTDEIAKGRSLEEFAVQS